MQERHIRIDHQCPGLIPERRLYLTRIILDEHAIRIEYVIVPALPIWDQARGRPPIHWLWHAVDDLGNRYIDSGGAYGVSSDGESTEGVLSLQPLPPPDARSLRVVLSPWFQSESDARECTFDVDLAATAA
jgi:hypothetical protein